MNSHGRVAVLAAQRLVGSDTADPEWVWMGVAREVFPQDSSSVDKGCPRGAFLGLCKRGAITDVRGYYELKDSKNGGYACRAWQALKRRPELAQDSVALWAETHPDAANQNG